jgi:hypothetical protein
MSVSERVEQRPALLGQLDLGRIRQHRWWIVLLLAVGTIVLTAFVRSWAECRYAYQAELDCYMAHPDDVVRPPQMRSMPLLTVLVRIGGRLVQTAAAWAAWIAGLYLIGLLLGQRESRLATTLQVVAWSWLPFVVRGLAQSVYMALTQDPIYNPGLSGLAWDNTPPPPGGGYGYVMPTQRQRVWAALLVHLDIYLFWHLALIVGGLRRVSGYTLKKALATTLSVSLLLGTLGLVSTVFGTAFRQFRLF